MLFSHSRMKKGFKTIGILILCIVAGEITHYVIKYPTLQTAKITDAKTVKINDVTRSNTTGPDSSLSTHTPDTMEDAKTMVGSSELKNRAFLSERLDQDNGFSQPPEVQHIVFLKVHKAASTTVQSMIFRFGYTRSLDFVLPVTRNYFSRSTSEHRPILPPIHGDHYDIFCVHCFYNHSIVSAIMHRKPAFIAIVRDPWSQFVSAVNYYRDVFHFNYLKRTSGDGLFKLVMNSSKYEPSVLSYTMNSMARDFGFSPEHYFKYSTGSTSSSAHGYLEEMDKVFNLVMVAEWFDESLILMKRLLNWKLRDILYTSKNVHHKETNVSVNARLMKAFKKRNKLDYLVYEHFQEKFQNLVKLAGENLRHETANFKVIVANVQSWCSKTPNGTYIVSRTEWNEDFEIDRSFCMLMRIGEIPFIKLLKHGTR